ncbi:MAG: hypothetical protein ACLT4C_08385 [Butyricicoccus sp.]
MELRKRHRNAHPHPWLCGQKIGHGGNGITVPVYDRETRRAYQRGGCPHGKARYITSWIPA